jgi:Holliday junction resolvase RusA-like endonuclease
MIYIEIPFDPVPWAAPRLSRHHAYDPKEKEKRAIRYIIKEQYSDEPIEGYVALFFSFVFQIPKSASKAKRAQMLQGLIIPTRSDCTNCQKLYEDCLKNVVFRDDRNVEVIGSRKLYAEKGSVNITILNRDEYQNKLRFPCKL